HVEKCKEIEAPSASHSNMEKGNIIQELVCNMERMQADIIAKDNIIKEKSDSHEGPSCVICIDRAPNMMFFDCMHLVVCEECFNEAARNTST
ncbi:hypothetical protein PMAYCL1PPCAC_09615, partial [Pristionchus mayeri]